jgi:glycosyltransferase involved in cell wall biosynthesis
MPVDNATYIPLVPASIFQRLAPSAPDLKSYMPPRPISWMRFARWIEHSRYDVYHLFGYGFTLIDIAGASLERAKKPFGVTLMGAPYSPLEHGGLQLTAFRAYERMLGLGTLRNAKRLHSISHDSARHPSFAHVTNKIDVIHCGVGVPPTIELSRPKNVPNQFFLSIGRVQWSKGFETAVQALDIARRRGTRYNYCIAGPPAGYERDLLRLAERLGVSSQFTLLGRVSESEKEWLYRNATALLIPSLFEPFGLVSLEAMIRGLPVAASAVGGLAETIEDGKTGHLFKPGDATALADILASLSTRRDEQMVDAARDRALSQTWETVAARHLDWYRDHLLK